MTWFPLRTVPALLGLDDEAGLLAGLRARRAEALDRVASRYGTALTRAAWLWLGNGALAEEAANDALIAAWDGAHRTDAGTTLRPWLFGILCNHCRKRRREAARRRAREDVAATAWMQARSVAPDARLSHLREALDALDDDLREVVILRFLEEFPVADAARALGIPVGTVKSRTHTALARLRAILERAP